MSSFVDRCGALAIHGLSWVCQRIPERLGVGLGLALGWIWSILDGRHRRVAHENLRLAFGQALDSAARSRIVRATFRNVALTAVEFLTMPRWSYEDLLAFVQLDGDHLIDEALAEGRGVVILAAHFGNWELMAGGASLRGLPLSAVARPLDQHAINAEITAIRESTGLKVVQRRAGAIAAFRTLRKGGVLGILADQNTRRDHVFVEFFGRPAATTPAPAFLALKTGAPIIPCYMIRTGARAFRFEAHPRLSLIRTGDFDRDVLLNTQRCAATLEAMVRQYPENWFWIHRRWKTQPPAGWKPPHVPEEAEVPAG